MPSLFYDVVLVAPDGTAIRVLAAGLPMDEALKIFQAHDPKSIPAVVAFAGAVSPRHKVGNTQAEASSSDDDPEVRFREDISKELEQAELGGDYTRIPALGLQLALLRHLDEIESEIIEGHVKTVAHIGQIARSLERFCAQCIEQQEPRRSKWDDSLDWDSDEFNRGRLGEIGDDELEGNLNRFMDSSLRRDYPELFEAEEAA